MCDPISSSARQDLSEMAASSSRDIAPAPGILRSITYLGMASPSSKQYTTAHRRMERGRTPLLYAPQEVSGQSGFYTCSAIIETVGEIGTVLDPSSAGTGE